jgi:epoxyqueuosine reductase
VLEARRCISYLTIESRQVPPAELRGVLGDHLFGCDECQRVCPHNQGLAAPPEVSTAPFVTHARWAHLGLADVVGLDEPRWREVSQGTALKRAGRVGLARNALLVAAHRLRRGDPKAAEVLALGCSHDDPDVAELARQELARARRRRPLS